MPDVEVRELEGPGSLARAMKTNRLIAAVFAEPARSFVYTSSMLGAIADAAAAATAAAAAVTDEGLALPRAAEGAYLALMILLNVSRCSWRTACCTLMAGGAEAPAADPAALLPAAAAAAPLVSAVPAWPWASAAALCLLPSHSASSSASGSTPTSPAAFSACASTLAERTSSLSESDW